MKNENKIYITASELSEILGVSVGHSYKLIKKLNKELESSGYITIAGKLQKAYLEKRYFSYTS